MEETQVVQDLQGIFDNVFLEPVEVSRTLSADQVEEWDSLLQINLVVAVEQKFGVNFRMGEVEATRNVGDFIDLIIKRRNER